MSGKLSKTELWAIQNKSDKVFTAIAQGRLWPEDYKVFAEQQGAEFREAVRAMLISNGSFLLEGAEANNELLSLYLAYEPEITQILEAIQNARIKARELMDEIMDPSLPTVLSTGIIALRKVSEQREPTFLDECSAIEPNLFPRWNPFANVMLEPQLLYFWLRVLDQNVDEYFHPQDGALAVFLETCSKAYDEYAARFSDDYDTAWGAAFAHQEEVEDFLDPSILLVLATEFVDDDPDLIIEDHIQEDDFSIDPFHEEPDDFSDGYDDPIGDEFFDDFFGW